MHSRSELRSKAIWPPPYKLVRHKRAKQVIFRITRRDGLSITIPHRFNIKNLPELLNNKKKWIEKELKILALEGTKDFYPNSIALLACGDVYEIQYCYTPSKLRVLQTSPQALCISGEYNDASDCQKLLSQWLKRKAELVLFPWLQDLSQTHELPFRSAKIRSQSTRWGSCSSAKDISLNFKLLFLPTKIVEYVLLHELCHTVHLDHSAKFWTLLHAFLPETSELDERLKQLENTIPKWTEHHS